jgi:hypothetical protein
MAKRKRPDKLAPHLIRDGRFQRCSICKTSFLAESDRSLPEDFANHVKRLHQPDQTSEDVNQATFRVITEAADKV